MLPHVYCVFAEPGSDCVWKALEACTKVYWESSATQLIRLEEQFRQTSSVEWSINWKEISILPVLRQCVTEEQRIAFLGFGSFHPKGYYRQRCVEALADYPNGALPFLFLRLNDWVSPVGRATQIACKKVLETCPPEVMLSALLYLQKAKAGSRSSQFVSEQIMPSIADRLRQPDNKPYLDQALICKETMIRRLCYQLAMEGQLLTDAELLSQLSKERDPMTRLMVARSLFREEAEATDESQLATLLGDKSPAIRLFALKKLYDLRGSVWEGLRHFLLDPSARVREYVQFLFRKDTEISLPGFYREHLDTPQSVPAILGLGETGDASDAALLKAYLHSPRTKQVQAVLRSVAKLSGAAEEALYMQYLFDQRPGVAKRAFFCLRDTCCKPDGEQLYRALEDAISPVLKKRLLQLLASLSYWNQVYYLLLCAAREDVGEMAREKLRILRGTFLTPSVAQLERCRSALISARPYLDANLYRMYEFSFEHAGK